MASIAETTFGFVGCGTMCSAIVRGLCTLDTPPKAIFVSPRNAQKSAALASEFEIVTVAADNQSVVDNSQVVFIGVLPQHTEETCKALSFSASQTVVSVVSTAPLAGLQQWCAPVLPSEIVRAIPLPPVAQHAGSCVITPKHRLAEAVFEKLGTAVAVDTEAEFKRMMPMTCLMGQIYAQQSAATNWLIEQGIDGAAAAKWVGAVYHTVTHDAKAAGSQGADGFQELVAEQTPGGLNEQVIREMREGGAQLLIETALDGCLARIEGVERPAKRVKSQL